MIAECLTLRVLREHGIATGATPLPRVPVAPESKAGRPATGATGATAQKYMGQREAPDPPHGQTPTDRVRAPQKAGCKVVFLRRNVTCATCLHQQRRPDTSEAGMHSCDRGHRLHYAREQHACADWKAQP